MITVKIEDTKHFSIWENEECEYTHFLMHVGTSYWYSTEQAANYVLFDCLDLNANNFAATIVELENRSGAWPVTKTEEDAFKLLVRALKYGWEHDKIKTLMVAKNLLSEIKEAGWDILDIVYTTEAGRYWVMNSSFLTESVKSPSVCIATYPLSTATSVIVKTDTDSIIVKPDTAEVTVSNQPLEIRVFTKKKASINFNF